MFCFFQICFDKLRRLSRDSLDLLLFFFNLSRLFALKITEKQAKKTLYKALKFFIAKKNILSMRRIIVDDRLKTIIEISLSEKSRKAFSSSSFLLFFAVIKLHVDARKKVKRAFHAVVKFVFEESKRNVSDCDCKKMNTMTLWKLDSEECKIDELFLILQELKQIQKNEKKENVYRSHWRLITWKFKLILMNNRNTELTKKILLIKLYHCFDHVKKFDDLKTRFNTEIWFRSECRSVKFNDVSRALKFRQMTVYTISSKLRWNFITSELFETKRTEKWI